MARPRQVTDEAILEATRAATLEHGPAVSLELIADRLGVTPPALIKRFGSRQALMVAALRPPEEPPWVRELAEGPDHGPLCGQLEGLLSSILDFLVEFVPRMCTLRESGIPLDQIYPASQAPPPVRGIQALTAWLERAGARGLCHGEDFETAATAMIGALQSRVFVSHIVKRAWSRRSQREFLRDLAALFSRALAPTSGASSSAVDAAALADAHSPPAALRRRPASAHRKPSPRRGPR